MTKSRDRVSHRKHKSVKYGRRIARLDIGYPPETFTIHEDLLCARSPYFYERLQKKRKDVEGDCFICHDDLRPGTKELTFCKSSCGTNVHYDCMQQAWEDAQSDPSTSDDADNVFRCPVCRTEWVEPEQEQELTCTNLNATAFDMYTEWLYTNRISTSSLFTNSKNASDPHHKPMIAAYSLGESISDSAFQTAVLHAWVEVMEDSKTYPTPGLTARVYENFPAGSPIRRLMVETWATKAGKDWYERGDWDMLCQEFMRDVLVRMHVVGPVPKEKTVRELKRVCKDIVVEELVEVEEVIEA